jgi:Fe-S-cluster containining protein
MYLTELLTIAKLAEERETENIDFQEWMEDQDDAVMDATAHAINELVSAAIDCTVCANCCKSLVIDVASSEMKTCAKHLQIPEETFKAKYLEESQQGRLFINTIPCHFLHENKCSIYEIRFADCREFPHLHKPGFIGRLSGTMLHYGKCPIIYNVVEEMKIASGFSSNVIKGMKK